MIVVLIGQEQNMAQHITFWLSRPGVDLKTYLLESEDSLAGLADFMAALPKVDVVDTCVPDQYKLSLLEQLTDHQPIIMSLPLAASLEEEQQVLHLIEEKALPVIVANPLLAKPEMASLCQSMQNKQLGKTGVNRLSLQTDDIDYSYSLERQLIDWLVQSFGDYQSIYAKQIRDRYKVVQIRHADQSFTQVELAYQFGKEALKVEMTGDAGMLSYDSAQSAPIQLTGRNITSRSLQTSGKTLVYRMYDPIYQALQQRKISCDYTTTVLSYHCMKAIDQAYQQSEPVVKGGAKNA